MRQSLFDLITSTVIYQYDLPNTGKSIVKTLFSTDNDKCYLASNIDGLAEIIYNSIIEYSFNEFELTQNSYSNLHSIALQSKIKYNPNADDEAKQKYGFFGEVLLYCILAVQFKAKPIIARGYFYNPLENSETKGYDSYQLVENDGKTELWFGEVKFYIQYGTAIKKIVDNLDKALSDAYLNTNIIALNSERNNFNVTGSKIDAILSAWNDNPSIVIVDEIKKHNMKLIYPILLLYEQDATGYDSNIKKVITHIEDNYVAKTLGLSIEYSIFFILMPLEKVSEIKSSVIQWIESKKPLMS